MKKIMTLALCAVVAGSMSAQKSVVKQAEKLSGNVEKIAEARQLIQEAMNNPETQNDPNTYFVAGKIEFDAFDKAYMKKAINPNDPSVDVNAMGEQLLNGYNYFVKALPLDSVPDAKGKVSPKYSGKIVNILNGRVNDFYGAGADFYNNKKYYPEAYQAFMIYGDFPNQGFVSKENKKILVDTVVAPALFNAGLAGWASENLDAAATGFRKAHLADPRNKQAYIYEIASWQNIANKDSLRVDEAQAAIMRTAKEGYDQFGLEEPLFINNMINSLVSNDKMDEALAVLADVVAANPENANIYGLRGFVYDRAGKDDLSEADYRKAASLPNVDFETLKNAAKKIYRIGATKYNAIEGNDPAARQNVKENYFLVAKAMTDKAKAMKADDSDLNYVIENIDYALETYF